MKKYAEGTMVSPEKSRMEIESLIKKNGGKNPCHFSSEKAEIFVFEAKNRRVKFTVEMPDLNKFLSKPNQQAAQAAEYRRLFRVLLLRLKAKFESVNSSEVSFDEEFLANIVDDSGATVWDRIQPSLQNFTADKLPKLLSTSIR